MGVTRLFRRLFKAAGYSAGGPADLFGGFWAVRREPTPARGLAPGQPGRGVHRDIRGRDLRGRPCPGGPPLRAARPPGLRADPGGRTGPRQPFLPREPIRPPTLVAELEPQLRTQRPQPEGRCLVAARSVRFPIQPACPGGTALCRPVPAWWRYASLATARRPPGWFASPGRTCQPPCACQCATWPSRWGTVLYKSSGTPTGRRSACTTQWRPWRTRTCPRSPD